MPATSINCPNCGHRLTTVDLAVPERPTSDSARTERRILLRVNEAAERLGVSRTTLYALIGKGQLRVVKIGRSIRVPWHELERLAEGTR